MTTIETAPTATHRGEEELPFVDLGDGTLLQLLQVDLAVGVWVIRSRFAPGTTIALSAGIGTSAAAVPVANATSKATAATAPEIIRRPPTRTALHRRQYRERAESPRSTYCGPSITPVADWARCS